LYEPVLRMMEDFIVRYGMNGEVKERAGNDQPHSCPNGIFPTADGGYVVLPASTNNMWTRLVALLDDPDGSLAALATPVQRIAERPRVNAAVSHFTSQYDRDDLIDLLRAHEIACGTVNTAADIVADPHIIERGNLVKVQDPELGELLVQAPIGRFTTISTKTEVGPRLGQHTDEVLGALSGMTPDRLDSLRKAGII